MEAPGNCRSTALDALVTALLEEVERSGHKRELFTIFTACMTPLLLHLGLYTVKHLPRLMPLLLQEQLVPGSRRLAAALLLAEVVRRSWPRMPAHALIVWEVLTAAAQQEDRSYFEGGEVRGEEAAAAVQLLKRLRQRQDETAGREGFEDVVSEFYASCGRDVGSSSQAGAWIAAASRVVWLLHLCAADALGAAAESEHWKEQGSGSLQGPCIQVLLAAANWAN